MTSSSFPGLPEASRPTIAMRDVNFGYKRGPVIVGFRWEVPSHCIAALLGLSGSGKSTMLALLAGALKPDSGSVSLDGSNPLNTNTRRLIGYMPQLAGLYPDLSVEENLQVFGAGSKASARGVDQILDLLQLQLRRRDLVRDLSAGFQQRVSLGVALVGGPSYLLLDDPFAYADGEFSRRIWAHLRELAAQGRTIIIATSNPQTAAKAHLVGVIRGGRLLSSNATAAIQPEGKGTVVLHYREKTGPRKEEVQVDNYRQQLTGIVTNSPSKPFEVEIRQETLENHLDRLMTEEPDHANPRA
ncbi:MAG: transporter related [Cyanobacteria bacterium RYN_339]|nr:transporter related [Cyanobacteria bacterium RYN_339]